MPLQKRKTAWKQTFRHVGRSPCLRSAQCNALYSYISARMSVIPPPVVKGLTTLRDALYKIGLKEPWKVTGSWTMPDYLHYLPSGKEYRKVSPGSQMVKVKIPHDHPSLVYDIKYFVRDHRRNTKWSAQTVDAKPFDTEKMFASAPLTPNQVKVVTRPAMMPTRGY